MTDTKQTIEITVVLPRDLAEQLTKVAKDAGRSPEAVAGDALAEWLEDQADIAEANRVLAEGNPSYPLEEVWKMLELDD